MDKVKRFFEFLFSKDSLLRLLIIAGIFALLSVSDGRFNIRIDHYHNLTYGGFDVNVKEK
ncbi:MULTISPECIES: hypothetical protein [Ramlibacter]|uniref:Uncharacterized protein n=1 Tax=Ramlibacter rhizophilus TaxID=1781167 RepID=A0A4Z0BI78_9BURK|nr:hypothetical protein [Ramlibacter rhizophilus]TFY98480.1 hypothetical protein EZ242_13120 [Ramlibacter rhizophilus]